MGDDKVCQRDRNPLQPRRQLHLGGGGAPRLQARPRLRPDPQGEGGAGGVHSEGVGEEEEARGEQQPPGCYELHLQHVILIYTVYYTALLYQHVILAKSVLTHEGEKYKT